MATIAELADLLVIEVKKLIPNQTLIELTNDEGSAVSSINDTVLVEACKHTLSLFNLMSGIYPDTTNYFHVAILRIGVQWILMDARNYSSSVVAEKEKSFMLKCKEVRKLSYIQPSTSSPYAKSSPPQGTISPLDGSREVMSRRNVGPSQFSERNL